MLGYITINLYDTIYKIFSKLIVNRVKKNLHLSISNNQKGFVLGRKILYVVLNTHEFIHSMEKNKKLNMVLKLGISKAYDRVSWPSS